MKTFLLAFECSPTTNNPHFALLEGAIAHCMVLANGSQQAFNTARFHVEKDNWRINKIELIPIEITEKLCDRKDNFDQFHKAQEIGISIDYAAWARDENDIPEPTQLVHNRKNEFNLADFLKTQKTLKNKERCLHYDTGIRCNEIINAHSIQKNQSLTAIALDGQVYSVSQNIKDFQNPRRGLVYKMNGINKMSTFRGFCKLHDNELFKPIDDSKLTPTDQQVFLYAYRSLCKEVFAKENALDLLNSQIGKQIKNDAISKYLKSHKLGTSFGLRNLKRHKTEYDSSLDKDLLYDIEYVLFISRQNPFLAFSGLKYPDFDFMGRQLQDLGNHKSNLDLITFCSAPMNNNEWGILFSWHKSSSQTCSEFMRSFATMIHVQHNLGDLLFRFVVLSCENIAFSPTWWEGLSEEHRQEISTRTFEMIDDFTSIKPDYLQHGLENIVHWSFDQVISNMNN